MKKKQIRIDIIDHGLYRQHKSSIDGENITTYGNGHREDLISLIKRVSDNYLDVFGIDISEHNTVITLKHNSK